MKLFKKLITLLLVICLIFSFAACNKTSSEELNLNVCLSSEPQTIDPALNTTIDAAIMINHMFEGLMKYKDDGKGNATLTTGQAKSYSVSSDGTVYTFVLRDDAKWSDGKAVTASDFVYAWQRLINRKLWQITVIFGTRAKRHVYYVRRKTIERTRYKSC
jgi:oligopeptide transport system substrate-binding protein